ncbi:uncharacterized protein J4E78_002943 [Alternaria triticimaculans]|uniref:uncharacterized protein n=1 Tax=Alternaria triticimaculans TaxID=297637 RepID=UPI0020C29727|nr:uncharacterized protein J4E78_002943 [Alternaria triticimaculans]KAI4665481.1 hypothetical protein J4E78_002943 [Alternaria triticimaculans]
MVPEDFDTTWASSHLPHKYGGLKVCYIEQILEPTMLPTRTETTGRTFDRSSLVPLGTPGSSPAARSSAQSLTNRPSLKLNDFVEARPKSNHRNEKFSGRVALKCGTIHQSFDQEARIYPNGFNHDITLIKPAHRTLVKDVASPISGIGWLNHDSWISLRQQTTTIKILADAESSESARGSQAAKSIKCSRPSDILVVGEGIFLNQKAAAGNSKSLKHHDAATWKDLVSRAILYRVYPDFDPPNGHSGTALYADGTRTDGTEGPGVVGFQSFVQRSGHVQNFEMEGDALERRLRAGRVAFYGAFEVPAELKKYHIY